MAANKTQTTNQDVLEYLESIPDPQIRADCLELIGMMRDITGAQPRMWGKMVGFGEYRYQYASGREGDYFILGFAPQSKELTIYLMPGYQDFSAELARLGKHKMGKSCLYLKSLQAVDKSVLTEMMVKSVRYMREHYPTK